MSPTSPPWIKNGRLDRFAIPIHPKTYQVSTAAFQALHTSPHKPVARHKAKGVEDASQVPQNQ